jgi:hypothetical protein
VHLQTRGILHTLPDMAEETSDHFGLEWTIRNEIGIEGPRDAATIYVVTRASWTRLAGGLGNKLRMGAARLASSGCALPAEGFALQTGAEAKGRWIAVWCR